MSPFQNFFISEFLPDTIKFIKAIFIAHRKVSNFS
jgi:hypothetical protein